MESVKVLGVCLQVVQLGQHPQLGGYGPDEFISVKGSAQHGGTPKRGKGVSSAAADDPQ